MLCWQFDTTHPDRIRYVVLLILATGILVCLAGFCLHKSKQLQTENSNRQQKVTSGDQSSNKTICGENAILLTLDIKNVGALYQKTNSSPHKNIVSHLFQRIQKALSLYNGNVAYIGSSTIVLSFEQHGFEQHHAIFNAICCGYIINQLNRKARHFSLPLTICIHRIPEKKISKKQATLLPYKPADDAIRLTIEASLLKNDEIKSRLLIKSNSSKKDKPRFISIDGFQKNTLAYLIISLNFIELHNSVSISKSKKSDNKKAPN